MLKRLFPKHCALAGALALALAQGGCAQLELCAVPAAEASGERPEKPAALYVTESDLVPPPPAPARSAPPAEAAVTAPATARLDPEGEAAPSGGPARLAGADTPEASAGDYPGLTPAELEHYLVGRHVGYQE